MIEPFGEPTVQHHIDPELDRGDADRSGGVEGGACGRQRFRRHRPPDTVAHRVDPGNLDRGGYRHAADFLVQFQDRMRFQPGLVEHLAGKAVLDAPRFGLGRDQRPPGHLDPQAIGPDPGIDRAPTVLSDLSVEGRGPGLRAGIVVALHDARIDPRPRKRGTGAPEHRRRRRRIGDQFGYGTGRTLSGDPHDVTDNAAGLEERLDGAAQMARPIGIAEDVGELTQAFHPHRDLRRTAHCVSQKDRHVTARQRSGRTGRLDGLDVDAGG